MKVTVHRTVTWVQGQRIASGRNVPESIEVEVDPAQLSLETRRRLIEATNRGWGPGDYRDVESIGYDVGYTPGLHSHYGFVRIVVDEEAPSVGQIDAAILSAFAAIERAGSCCGGWLPPQSVRCCERCGAPAHIDGKGVQDRFQKGSDRWQQQRTDSSRSAAASWCRASGP